jgi:hypothetical protein
MSKCLQSTWSGRVWHLTSITNLVQILVLRQGVIARAHLESNAIGYSDISIANVQKKRREKRPDPKAEYNLHQYVPLFFWQQNAMMHSLSGLATDLVWLAIDTTQLDPALLFTSDGNAACHETRFYQGLRPDCVQWAHMSDQHMYCAQCKRTRAAELLVRHIVPASAIVALEVATEAQCRDLRACGLPVTVAPQHFGIMPSQHGAWRGNDVKNYSRQYFYQ